MTARANTKSRLKCGLSVSLGGGAITNAVSAAGNIERASEVKDNRLKGLYAYKAANDLGKLTKGPLDTKVSVSVSIGSSKQTSEQTVHTETVNVKSQYELAYSNAKFISLRNVDTNDSSNAELVADEVEKLRKMNNEVQDSVIGSLGGGPGFKTFAELKKFLGSLGAGNQWHHIVEQAQQNASRAGFAAEEINTVENIIALQSGKGSTHSAISGLYSSKPYWAGGLTVRDWLATKSFAEQFEFGMNVLKDYGKVVRDSAGRWIFTPFE